MRGGSDYCTVNEAAAAAGCGRDKVRAAMDAGLLPYVTVAGRYYCHRADVAAWRQSLHAAPDYLTVADVAERFGLSRRAARGFLRAQPEAYRACGEWRWPRSAYEALRPAGVAS